MPRRLTHVVISLAALTILVAGGAFGIAYAHAAPHVHIKPSCFWTPKSSASHSYYSGSTLIGTYYAYIQESTCQANDFRNGGEFDGTQGQESGCQSASVNVTGTFGGNKEPYMDGSASSGSFGASSTCSTNYLEWDASIFTVAHGTVIGSCSSVQYAGSIGSTICVSYTYP